MVLFFFTSLTEVSPELLASDIKEVAEHFFYSLVPNGESRAFQTGALVTNGKKKIEKQNTNSFEKVNI